MKKFVIYLLTLMMVFSPMTAFAVEGEPVEGEGQVPVEELQDQDAEVTEEATPAEDVEAVEEAAPAAEEEAVVEEEPEETAPAAEEEAAEPEEAAPAAEEEAPEVLLQSAADTDTDTYVWEDETYTKAYKLNEQGEKVYAKGVFKAKRYKTGETDPDGTSLFYADGNGIVAHTENLVEGKDYIHEKDTEGEAWKVSAGTYKYLVTYHSGYKNGFFVYWQKGRKDFNGNTYFIQDNGTVRTSAGVQQDGSDKYYIQDGGAVLKTVGFTPDHKYYVNDTTGKLRLTQGKFQAKDGKYYYTKAGGEVPSTVGLYPDGSVQCYVKDSYGTVKTDAGFITVNGKKYLVQAGGAISKTVGPITYGGNKYLAEPGGAIRTTAGFYNYGGKVYYVTNSSGVLRVNKAFTVSGKKYHAMSDGTIAVGVHKWKKSYYYSKASGALRTKVGVVKWNGNYYHVKKSGKVTTNKKVKYKKKTYIANKKGVIYRGLFTWKKNMYYANSKGVLRVKAGLFKYDGNRYYSRSGGKLYRNTLVNAGGSKYLVNKDAKVQYGYLTWKGKHYLTNDKGAIFTKTGIYDYKNKQYFVKKGGAMASNEVVTYKDDHYYINTDGSIAKSTFKYKGIKVTPNSKTGKISLEDYWRLFPNEKPKEDDTNNNTDNNTGN